MQTTNRFMDRCAQAATRSLKGDEVIVKRYGDGVSFIPEKNAWRAMFDAVRQFEGTIEREPQGEQNQYLRR